MTRHLSHNTLIRMTAGTLSLKALEAAYNHIANCESCSAACNALSGITAPSGISHDVPSRGLEEKILRLYRRIAHSTGNPGVLERLKYLVMGPYRPAFAAGVLAMLVLSAWIFTAIIARDEGRPIPISISYLKGKAFINNHEINSKTRITENCILRISKNSELVLSYNTSFTIKIGSGSVLEIKKATIDQVKQKMEFVFSLEKGTLYTRFDGLNGSSNYFYITPTARIKASKTEFILKVAENKTIVIPGNGVLEIKSIASDEEVITLPNKKYIITSSIESRDTNDFDEINTDRLRNMDNPLRGIDMSDILEDFSESI